MRRRHARANYHIRGVRRKAHGSGHVFEDRRYRRRSGRSKHKGEIEILSFSWGPTNRAAGTGGGGGAGKVVAGDFTIVKALDNSSPNLIEKCAGASTSLERLASRSRDKPGETKLEYPEDQARKTCLISSYSTGGSGGDEPFEQVSFSSRASRCLPRSRGPGRLHRQLEDHDYLQFRRQALIAE